MMILTITYLVLNRSFDGDRFMISFSSNNLLKNIIAKEVSDFTFVATDATYMLNNVNLSLI